ncbi:hypothetical protein ACMD2_14721 [Ananas comosus]|uniref:Uncharacterized protein n=1 Tax=Ananas comosus TaxID=4615 RepID=A0A199UJS2_ANACO|nr:hypothetical protein ACMD2_14721 [Ananas comosus]
MQLRCLDACGNLTFARPLLGFHHRHHRLLRRSTVALPSPPPSDARVSTSSTISCARADGCDANTKGDRGAVRARRKENVWSVDNDLAARASVEEKKLLRRRKGRGRRTRSPVRRGEDSKVLVSGNMLMEIETVLQTQEPVIKPSWDTFASSVSGIWKGVGAVFSPFTGEMEPIGIGNQNENLYDCYTLSRIEKLTVEDHGSEIRRKTNWVVLNPFGETRKQIGGGQRNKDVIDSAPDLPAYETFDFKKSEVLEEDDGSYSRGPVDIPVGKFDESKYFLSPTFKFEQCLVKGCHKRLRIVHTIEFNEGGSSIQIVRVAVFEEQWVSPANLHDGNDVICDLKPISQRKRTQPSELTGSWKVFEVSATPIFDDEETEVSSGLPYVYLCTETLKKRSLPESSLFFGEEEMLDMQDCRMNGYLKGNRYMIRSVWIKPSTVPSLIEHRTNQLRRPLDLCSVLETQLGNLLE